MLSSPLIISWKRFQRNLINPTISMARWDKVKGHNRVSYCALPWTGWAVHHTACTRYRLRTHSTKGIRRTVGAKITRRTRVEYDSVEEPSIFEDPPFPWSFDYSNSIVGNLYEIYMYICIYRCQYSRIYYFENNESICLLDKFEIID